MNRLFESCEMDWLKLVYPNIQSTKFDPNFPQTTNNSYLISGNRPPSANNRLVINAPQKVGMGGPLGVTGGVVERIGGLTVTQAAMQNTGVSGVAMSNLNDPNKNLLNFNI